MDANFQKHREQIARAREKTDALLSELSPGHGTARDVIEGAWQLVFDLLCTLDNADLSELNTLSGIIQRLMSSNTHIKSLEIKLREDVRKEEEFIERKQQLEDNIRRAREASEGITAETLERIEAQLKLL